MDSIIMFISIIVIYLIEENTLEKRLKFRSKLIKLCKKEYIYFIAVVTIVYFLQLFINLITAGKIVKLVLSGIQYGTLVFFVKIYKLKEKENGE